MVPTDQQVKLSPGLYVVATPIGNLRDITLRALDVLGAADVIACEDTRITRRLLDRYDIVTKMLAYHDHNAPRVRPKLMARLKAGEAVALVSDAGTPLISDPGFKLINEAYSAGAGVWTVPGPSAVTAGLSVAGLPSDRFCFYGFLPEKTAARKKVLNALSGDGTAIFFEAARRLPACLKDLAAIDPEREIAIARELTKRFEEVRRGSALELCDHYQKAGPPKGEVVLLIGPAASKPADQADVDAALVEALSRLSVKDAASEVSALTKHPRRAVYERALVLKKGKAEAQ